MNLRAALIITLLINLTFLTGCKKELPEKVVDDYTWKIDQLTDSLISKVTYNGNSIPLPGLIVGVWHPSKDYTYLKAKGYANVATGRLLKLTDLFRIASITKTFTATMILELAEEGKIGLDDAIEKYIPGIPNGKHITIRQLLAMQSGLFEVNDDPEISDIFDNDPNHYFTPQELLNAINSHNIGFNPGERTVYCNSNYIILGILIEQITKQPYDEALKSRITGPLRMVNTSFAKSQYMPSGKVFCSGYMLDGNFKYIDASEGFNMSVAYSAGAIISDLNDLQTWIRILTSGALLSSSTQKQMKVFNPIFGDTEYGLGLMRYRGNFIGHSGDGLGYHSFMARNVEKDITIAIFFNGEYPYPQFVFHELLKILE